MAPETTSQPGYSLEETLAQFDVLIDQLSQPLPEPEFDDPPSTDSIGVERVSSREIASDDLADVIAKKPAKKTARKATGKIARTLAERKPDAQRTVAGPSDDAEVALTVTGLTKKFGSTVAVSDVDLRVLRGSMFGIVGPNGAGKTTTLSMVTGLLRPDSGAIELEGADVWAPGSRAKQQMGILPDRLIFFDRLTGRQLLHYTGLLRGLDAKTTTKRTADLIATIGIEEAQNRLVTDYSAGMTKKVALAAAMIHAPKLLVLDEPFESVDTVSAERIIDILRLYVGAGGTVILSSHSMDLVERICDRVAVVVDGRVLSAGTIEEVRGDQSLEERFVDLVQSNNAGEDLEWLRSFSD